MRGQEWEREREKSLNAYNIFEIHVTAGGAHSAHDEIIYLYNEFESFRCG